MSGTFGLHVSRLLPKARQVRRKTRIFRSCGNNNFLLPMNKFTGNYEPSLTGLHSPVGTAQFFVHEFIHGADPVPRFRRPLEETNTKYNIWAYTSTAKGTTYSSKIRIWTYGLMDYDGNGYHTVKIGNQTWAIENLKVTHYNNGDPIPEVQDSTIWLHDTKGARCYYRNNKAKYDSVYGALYNWYVINDPRGITPKGWHVPTDYEYNDLSTYLGKNSVVGGKMKEKGTKHWKAPNTGATNSSGFTALPGGMRGLTYQYKTLISFADIGGYAYFWTSARSPIQNTALAATLDYNDTWFDAADAFKNNSAFSIRLVKDK